MRINVQMYEYSVVRLKKPVTLMRGGRKEERQESEQGLRGLAS